MGMVIVLYRASAAIIDEMIADPSRLEALAFGDDDGERQIVDFDKAWHALHFMLTGAEYDTDSPLGIIASERPEYGADENGFGGFAVITPAEMEAFHASLATIDDATLASRLDAAEMVERDIYIADAFAEDDREEAVEYIMQSVPALRRLAADCAGSGDGALRILT